MTQPQPPGQPYFPQQPSAPSAPIPGQPYPQQAPGQPFQPAPGAPAGMPGAGQAYPPQVPAESFFGNLFDTSKGFVQKFGKAVFIIAVVALVVGWLYSAYQAGDNSYDRDTGELYFSFAEFLVDLVMGAPWVVTEILLIRLFIELVSSVTKRPQA